MFLPDVQYWELVVSQGLQTLCECQKRGCGAAADLHSGENQHPGEDADGDGQRRAETHWQKLLEKELEWKRKKLKGPKNTAKAHRERGREVGEEAGKHQDTENSTESCDRGSQETCLLPEKGVQ